MIVASECFTNALNAPVRSIKARVEVYTEDNINPVGIYGCGDNLKSLTLERVSEEGKFFGTGVCQKINAKIIDTNRELDITTLNNLEIEFGTDYNYIYTTPLFYITEVHRDETTNEMSITAYDKLYQATAHNVSELELPANYTIKDYAIACANLLGLPLTIYNTNSAFDTIYSDGANFEGTETIREALNAIAEATQTIYYIDSQWELTFRRLDKSGSAVFTINKDRYFNLDAGENRRLSAICSANELGNNVIASTGVSGTTQYIRDNPFWEMRDDIGDLVDAAIENIGGITINQFECSWRGNFLLEIGDKIALTTKDNKTIISYLLDDVISFDGSMSAHTRWNYVDNAVESADNPTSLGDTLKRTFARVDKANKQIELLASETATNYENITSLLLNTDSITATVEQLIEETADGFSGINGELANLTTKVEASMSADDVSIAIQSQLANGVDTITTRTGYVFDEEGLTISKTGTEMATQITEDGMTVYRDNNAVLIANNIGVDAVNLHATTYLIIGNNSRFEDYGLDRSACFWIGE